MNPSLFLIDGGLSQQPLSRSEVTALMAADLVRLDAWRNHADAMRALLWQCDAANRPRYGSFEVSRFLDDARQAAMQETVAQMMSDRPGCERNVGQ